MIGEETHVDAERVEMTEGAECTEVQSAKLCHPLNEPPHLTMGAVEAVACDPEQFGFLPIIGFRCRTCAVIRPAAGFLNGEALCLRCRRLKTLRLRERWQARARTQDQKAWVRGQGRSRCGRCYARGHNASSCDRVLNGGVKTPAAANGFVYFIEARGTGCIKIGWATRVHRRLSALQTASPVPLVLLGWLSGSVGAERRLHQQFSTARVRPNNEWFKATPELISFIEATKVSR